MRTEFLFDPTASKVIVRFWQSDNKASGSIDLEMEMQKHETIETVGDHARHKLAEALEKVAHEIRHHPGL